MIHLHRPAQFTRAAERARAERQFVRRLETTLYEVTNLAKRGRPYLVRFTNLDGRWFAHCDCEAGHPTKGHHRVPLMCKHVFAACVLVKGISAMRRGH